MDRLPTMKDVAERAGVHPCTVSRVLSKGHQVIDSTREKVMKAVDELGYRPNPYISTLMRSRRQKKPLAASATLALLTTFSTRNGSVKEFPMLKSAFAVAKRQAEARGFRLEEVWAPLDKLSAERVSHILETRSIAGILLAPFPRPMDRYDLRWERFAAVAWGMSLSDARVHHVRTNHFGSVILAMDECHRQGYRRVGLAVREEANIRAGKRWEAAYYLKQREFAVENPPAPFLAQQWAQQPFLEWFKKERPDAVICDSRYGFVIKWLKSEGLRIPEDVGLASLSCRQDERVSGVLENWELQAIRGVNLVIDLLAGNELGLNNYPQMSMVEVVWNPGETLRRIARE